MLARVNMSKKIVTVALFLVVIVLFSFVFAACDKGGGEAVAPVDATYVIQYTDDTGTYSIDVKQGEPYSISAIPTREGYDFLGLFDAEVGGTQYVNAHGASLTPFADKKNLVLFPQFKAKEYRLVLNYQGAPVTGEREIVVSYGSRIESLPTDLTLEHKTFVGWWTEPDRKGLQVADEYGVIPEASLISPRNFDLSDPDGFIRLYAGFQGEMHTVTFYFEDGMAPEEREVEHGTAISSVETDTLVDGNAVLTWSLEPNDEDRSGLFTGRVESDLTLYALEYAPVITFDANGGDNNISSIVARAGSAIALPEATRENWQFAGWYTTGGVRYTATTMPQESIALTARWTPMLIFDERGGTLVDDIAAEQGTRVTLPETEKDGYIFAGWYTETGEEYTSTAMPSVSTKLVAKYRKVLTEKVVIFSNTETRRNDLSAPSIDEGCDAVDLTDIFNSGVRLVKITAHYQVMYENSSGYKTISSTQPAYTHMKWYSAYSASDAYCVWSYSDEHVANRTWSSITQTAEIDLNSGTLYVCRYLSVFYNRNSSDASWTDFWIEVEYPDMSQLY